MRDFSAHIKTKADLEAFIENGLLTEDEAKVLRLCYAGKSRIQISILQNVSVPTIDRTIKKIKKKYNNMFPDVDI